MCYRVLSFIIGVSFASRPSPGTPGNNGCHVWNEEFLEIIKSTIYIILNYNSGKNIAFYRKACYNIFLMLAAAPFNPWARGQRGGSTMKKSIKAALVGLEKALAIGSVLVTAGKALVDLFDEDDDD